jgi:hypothetical protein
VEEFALTRSVDLREVSYVFPLAAIPQWIAGRIFYQFLDQVLRWLLVPLIGAYAAYEALAAVVQPVGRSLALRPLLRYDLKLWISSLRERATYPPA